MTFQFPSSSKPVLEVHDLVKTFSYTPDQGLSLKRLLIYTMQGRPQAFWKDTQELQVLDHLSFSVYPGEFVGIMGKNGAGKSTLLKILSGIYAPNQGTVKVRGLIVPLIELGAGFHPDLTGLENIFLNAAILGFGKKAAQRTQALAAEWSELGEHLHRPVRNYSSGMLARLGFAVAVHLEAPILLVDEILSVGDAAFQRKCLYKIEELRCLGRTLILITHDQRLVVEHCSRCLVLSQGKKIFDGPASEGARCYEAL